MHFRRSHVQAISAGWALPYCMCTWVSNGAPGIKKLTATGIIQFQRHSMPALAITLIARSTIPRIWRALQFDHSVHSTKGAGQAQHLHTRWHGRQQKQGDGARQQGVSKRMSWQTSSAHLAASASEMGARASSDAVLHSRSMFSQPTH